MYEHGRDILKYLYTKNKVFRSRLFQKLKHKQDRHTDTYTDTPKRNRTHYQLHSRLVAKGMGNEENLQGISANTIVITISVETLLRTIDKTR